MLLTIYLNGLCVILHKDQIKLKIVENVYVNDFLKYFDI